MINGVRVRDSGVELSPTGTDRRGGPRTASNRTIRASSAIAAGSTRWLMRRTKRPLSASLEEWPVLAATPIYRYIKIFFISVAGQLATPRGDRQGLPAAFPGPA